MTEPLWSGKVSVCAAAKSRGVIRAVNQAVAHAASLGAARDRTGRLPRVLLEG